jgi:hypothetical protein
MTVDESALTGLRDMLAADDYQLSVAESGDGIAVRITAGPDACADCLVPKAVMRGVLHNALGIAEENITLEYPADVSP